MTVLAEIFRRLGPLRWFIIWFISPKFVLGVNAYIVNEHGHVWLQRHRFWQDQAWGMPGGMVGTGESLENALVREIKEETGKSSKVGALIGSEFWFGRGLSLCFHAELGDEPLQLDTGEILDAGFFDVERLPKPMLPQHMELITRIRRGDV